MPMHMCMYSSPSLCKIDAMLFFLHPSSCLTLLQVHCDPSNVDDVRKGLEGEGLNVVSSGVETVTEQPADLTEEQEEVFQSLVSTLEDHEDVNSVTHNVDM
mmetsp:Transcript_31178/g.81802  ORF Transcript_31178/g.81802 Transcript_31178/m.81802 type:complete len:101 (-) Transcript_31178:357-659(-)